MAADRVKQNWKSTGAEQEIASPNLKTKSERSRNNVTCVVRKRQNSGAPIVSVVGYTNAGKSTLLNVLTSSEVLVADQLFATLDPTSRRLRFPMEREAIITDTVGFIRDLPPDLIRAFRATLEELEGADVLLHVVDISDPMRNEKITAVRELLEELHIGEIPEILIYNKCDLVDNITKEVFAKKTKPLEPPPLRRKAYPSSSPRFLRDYGKPMSWKLRKTGWTTAAAKGSNKACRSLMATWINAA